MADADVTAEETGAGEAAGARRPVTVVLADDQALVRAGFRALLDGEDGDQMMASFLGSLPLVKVPVMGMSDAISLDDIDALVARFGG